ncbi:hypothetical protein [Azospirillum largimobile]
MGPIPRDRGQPWRRLGPGQNRRGVCPSGWGFAMALRRGGADGSRRADA